MCGARPSTGEPRCVKRPSPVRSSYRCAGPCFRPHRPRRSTWPESARSPKRGRRTSFARSPRNFTGPIRKATRSPTCALYVADAEEAPEDAIRQYRIRLTSTAIIKKGTTRRCESVKRSTLRALGGARGRIREVRGVVSKSEHLRRYLLYRAKATHPPRRYEEARAACRRATEIDPRLRRKLRQCSSCGRMSSGKTTGIRAPTLFPEGDRYGIPEGTDGAGGLYLWGAFMKTGPITEGPTAPMPIS